MKSVVVGAGGGMVVGVNAVTGAGSTVVWCCCGSGCHYDGGC